MEEVFDEDSFPRSSELNGSSRKCKSLAKLCLKKRLARLRVFNFIKVVPNEGYFLEQQRSKRLG